MTIVKMSIHPNVWYLTISEQQGINTDTGETFGRCYSFLCFSLIIEEPSKMPVQKK